MKRQAPMSVVTMTLKVEPWQADILNKRMELCRLVYNSLLKKKLAVIHDLEADPIYRSARDGIRENFMKKVYNESNPNFIKKYDETDFSTVAEAGISAPADTDALLKKNRKVCDAMLKEAGISKYAVISDAIDEAGLYPENLSSNMVIYSVATPLWAALDAYLRDASADPRPKEQGSVRSLASDGKSGIRIVDDSGHTLRSKIGGVIAMHIFSAVPAAKSA